MGAWKKFVAFGDNHGWLVDQRTERALARFIEHWKPDIRIHVGDCWDFGCLRRGISSADSEHNDTLTDDLLRGFAFLDKTRPNVLLLGNHDHRVFHTANNHSRGVVRMAASDVCARIEKYASRIKCKVVPYHYERGVHRRAMGRLSFVHGYSANMNAVAQHATHFGEGKGGGVIMGHLHRVEMQKGKRHSATQGWSIGCTCDFQAMDYASARLATAQWEQAFAFGVIRGEQYQVWLAKRLGTKWLLPTGIEEL